MLSKNTENDRKLPKTSEKDEKSAENDRKSAKNDRNHPKIGWKRPKSAKNGPPTTPKPGHGNVRLTKYLADTLIGQPV